MAATAERTDPTLWEKVKKEVTDGDKGGAAGEWSARKAQMAVAAYKKAGGGYKGRKVADNHLSQWTHEAWGTKSGHDSAETGERYLPEKAREALTDEEYRRTTARKRADTKAGRQFSAQPQDVAAKTRDARMEGLSKVELMARARHKGIVGRSRMDKAQLVQALAGHEGGAA